MIDWKAKAMEYAANNGYTWGSSALQHEYMYVCAAVEECARLIDAESFECWLSSTDEGARDEQRRLAAAIRALDKS